MKRTVDSRQRYQLMKAAGLLTERVIELGGSDLIEEFEFQLGGKNYMATLEVDYTLNYSTEDGDYDNYNHTVTVKDLGVDQVGDYQEYVPVSDPGMIASIEKFLNTDPALSKQIEDYVDIDDAEESYDDADEYFDDLEEDSDYNMGTPSGDTDAMGNIAEEKKSF